MKKNFLFFILLIIVCNSQGTEIKIFPDTTKCFSENNFEIKINIVDVENLFAVAFDIVYDTNYLVFDSIKEGNFLNENGQSQTLFIYSSQPGRVIVAISRMDYTEPGVSTINDTALVKTYFTAFEYGWTNIELENIGLFDPELNNIPFSFTNGIVQIPGPPTILPIPDTSFYRGDTLKIYLNDFVNDPDTPDSLLNWEVLQADYINYNLVPEENLLSTLSHKFHCQ